MLVSDSEKPVLRRFAIVLGTWIIGLVVILSWLARPSGGDGAGHLQSTLMNKLRAALKLWIAYAPVQSTVVSAGTSSATAPAVVHAYLKKHHVSPGERESAFKWFGTL